MTLQEWHSIALPFLAVVGLGLLILAVAIMNLGQECPYAERCINCRSIAEQEATAKRIRQEEAQRQYRRQLGWHDDAEDDDGETHRKGS